MIAKLIPISRHIRIYTRYGRRMPPCRVCSNSGLTILELLLALAITGIIGSAVAAMLTATAVGTGDRGNARSLVVRQKTLDARLSAACRSSKAILAFGSNYLVLWMADTNADKAPNLSELRRIEWDSAASQLLSYKAPERVNPDTSYPLDSNFNTVTAGLKGDVNFPAEIWAREVSIAVFKINSDDPATATLASYHLTLTAGSNVSTLIGAAALRQ